MTYVDAVVGLDIGTTASKALIRRLDDSSSLVVRLPTPWLNAELDAAALLHLALHLLQVAEVRHEGMLAAPDHA